MILRLPILRVVCALVLVAAVNPFVAKATEFSEIVDVMESNCLGCHDPDTSEGGIELSTLLRQSNPTSEEDIKLWSKVEDMVWRGQMPPEGEEPLTTQQKERVRLWFRETFVLRNGMPHIGPTPLRRLTRYELENTLEDVLAIELRPPYRDTITDRIEVSRITSIVPSDIPGESGFDNDSHRMGKLKPPLQEIADAVHYAVDQFLNDPVATGMVFGDVDLTKRPSKESAHQILSALLQRAYRCDQSRVPEFAKVYLDLYQTHFRESKDHRKSLARVFEMILVSPEFLYRLEQSKDRDTPYPVSGVELATRLSYFLWSTAPDPQLLRLGQDGSLLQEAVLRSQIDRMLDSPNRLTLAENFAGQWLGFGDLLTNSEYFVNERWNRETYDEILFFFDELIKSDKSLLELVQSDWIYKRSSQVKSKRYTPVDLDSVETKYAEILSGRKSKSTDKRRRYDPPTLVLASGDQEGGIITSPAIMRLTASKNRTSPIRRGVWVLGTVIGKHLEPPPDVPPLDEARQALKIIENPSVAEVIQQHVSQPQCVACHREIDPLGLGLENYAPLGQWRTRYPDNLPVKSGGVMPNGKAFSTPRELKQLLLEIYKDDIAKNFVEQMFAYALGRKLQPFDRISLDAIMHEIKKDGYKVNTVIEQIVLSKQFRNRQDR